MNESGLADLLPSLADTVWVGVSAGSMVLTPRIGSDFVAWPQAPDDRVLGVVDFSILLHLDLFPTNTLAHAERWAAEIGGPEYAMDEQTAIDGATVSERRIGEGIISRAAWADLWRASSVLGRDYRAPISSAPQRHFGHAPTDSKARHYGAGTS